MAHSARIQPVSAAPSRMTATEPLRQLLAEGEVPGPRGFLPPYEPLRRLPPGFEPWEEMAWDLSARYLVGRIRRDLAGLPELDPARLGDGPEVERGMLLLTFFAGAYVHATDPPAASLPPPVARPLVALSRRLGRPPILSHASLAMHNWRRLDPEGSIVVENLANLVGTHGSTDETWFLTIAVAIEACGGEEPARILRTLLAADEGDAAVVAAELERLAGTIEAITVLTERTREGCDPHVFYRRVRPPFSGWLEPGVIYEGTELAEPLVLAGGSAAQSPLIQCFDAALSVEQPEAARGPHLDMRRYMDPRHRRFVAAVEESGAIRRFASATGDTAVRNAYDAALSALGELRRVHMAIVNDYIVRQADPGAAARGTGGTDFRRFLGGAIAGTEDARLKDA